MTGKPASQMLRLRACPRCGGDLVLDADDYLADPSGDEFVCLQCGRRVIVPSLKPRLPTLAGLRR